MTDATVAAFLDALGMGQKPAAQPKPPDVRSFACQVVREYARLVTPTSPMRWEHPLRQKATDKEYRVTITLEEI